MKSPFKFLDSYTKDDRNIFFGRDREIEELYQRVFDSKILLVYGISGTGKSSLIHCGLANKFSDTDWLPVSVRRGRNIVDSLAEAISGASITKQDNKYATPMKFRKAVKSLYLDHYKPVFFIFDQFEELFIFGNKEERRSFIHIVKLLTESDFQCRFIFVMREEYMAGVTEFERYIPTFFANRVRIEKMSHANALEAIKGPCNVAGIELEGGFAETLIQILSPAEGDIELTYLQVFLDKLFRLASENSISLNKVEENDLLQNPERNVKLSFELDLLSKTGNVSDLLGEFLEDQISLMDDPENALSVLKAFVSGKGTKRPASDEEAIENIRSFGKQIPHETVKILIRAFVKLRVFRDKDDNNRYELRHDALAEKVFEKFSTAEKELLEIKQMIENAYQYYLKRNILLNNDDLEYIDNKDSTLNLDKEHREFMDQCRQHQIARQKAIKRLTILSAFAFIILLSTLIYTLINKSHNSRSILLAKASITQYIRPIDRLCIAASSWQSEKSEEAREALLKSFNESIRNPGDIEELKQLRKEYLTVFHPVSGELEYASYSKENNCICGCTMDSIYIWNKNGKIKSCFGTGGKLENSPQISNDGYYFGGINDSGVLKIWDISGNIMFSQKVWHTNINNEQLFRFTKGNRVLALSAHNQADLVDINGKTVQTFILNNGSANALDISDDERFIAIAGTDSCVNVWYLNSDEHRYDFYNKVVLRADTIYSVDFARNCKYFVSCTSRNEVVVASVNNKITWLIHAGREFDYGVFSHQGYPFFAEFNDSSSGIVIKSFPPRSDSMNYFMNAIYVNNDYNLVKTGQVSNFEYTAFSPENNYIAAYCNGITYLLAKDRFLYQDQEYILSNNYQLFSIRGEKPFFSPDGKYLFTINGSHLESWAIDIESIASSSLKIKEKWGKYLY